LDWTELDKYNQYHLVVIMWYVG